MRLHSLCGIGGIQAKIVARAMDAIQGNAGSCYTQADIAVFRNQPAVFRSLSAAHKTEARPGFSTTAVKRCDLSDCAIVRRIIGSSGERAKPIETILNGPLEM